MSSQADLFVQLQNFDLNFLFSLKSKTANKKETKKRAREEEKSEQNDPIANIWHGYIQYVAFFAFFGSRAATLAVQGMGNNNEEAKLYQMYNAFLSLQNAWADKLYQRYRNVIIEQTGAKTSTGATRFDNFKQRPPLLLFYDHMLVYTEMHYRVSKKPPPTPQRETASQVVDVWTQTVYDGTIRKMEDLRELILNPCDPATPSGMEEKTIKRQKSHVQEEDNESIDARPCPFGIVVPKKACLVLRFLHVIFHFTHYVAASAHERLDNDFVTIEEEQEQKEHLGILQNLEKEKEEEEAVDNIEPQEMWKKLTGPYYNTNAWNWRPRKDNTNFVRDMIKLRDHAIKASFLCRK
jgi:hypothetical protein